MAQEHSLQTILSIARTGATSRAWAAFIAAGYDQSGDMRALTLKGRLLKDRARLAAGAERQALFAQSAEAYEIAAAIHNDSYPLINAAAMALFAGDKARTQAIASRVLELIEGGVDRGETPYWGEATRAEALLLLDRREDAEASFARAIQLAPEAWEDHAATLRQFALLTAQHGGDVRWLDRFRPPPVLHFSGMMGIASDDRDSNSAIFNAIEAIAPGFGVGALAAGSDIIAAEALAARGAELHVVLPSDPADFRRSSVEPFGQDWATRFDALLSGAHNLVICGTGDVTSEASVALADYHAMGLAAELAGQLETRAVALRVEPVGRGDRQDPWSLSGRDIQRVAIAASSPARALPLPQDQLRFDIIVDDSTVRTVTQLADAVAALAGGRDAIAAIDCRLDGAPRVASFLAHGQPGMVAASRDAALALLACGAVQRIEPIGEMASAVGPVELCLVVLNRAQT